VKSAGNGRRTLTGAVITYHGIFHRVQRLHLPFQLARLLDLFVSGEFSKEMLIERKTRLEETTMELERVRADLLSHLQSTGISDEQIAEIEEFCEQVREGLAHATFEDKRHYLDLLDVRGILVLENGEKVVYITCKLGKQRLLQMQISHSQNNHNGQQPFPITLTARLIIR
jgi:hypothetical protein